MLKNNKEDIWGEGGGFAEGAQGAVPDEELYTVKADGKEFQMTMDELLQAAAKGVMYDQMQIENENIANSEEVKLFEKLEAMTGLSRERLGAFLENCIKTAMIHNRKCELIEEGAAEDWADKIASLEFDRDMGLGNSSEGDGMQRLLAAYPDAKNLPDSVRERIDGGEDPLFAYQQFLIDEKEKALKNLQVQSKNKEKFMGSVKGRQARSEDELSRILMES